MICEVSSCGVGALRGDRFACFCSQKCKDACSRGEPPDRKRILEAIANGLRHGAMAAWEKHTKLMGELADVEKTIRELDALPKT